MTKTTFIDYLRHEKRYSPHTIEAYGNDLDQFKIFLNRDDLEVSFTEVTYNDVRAWVIELMEQDLTPKSINRKLASLKSFYKFLQAQHGLAESPANRVKSIKTGKQLPHFIKKQELDKLLQEELYPDTLEGLRDRLVIELLYGTGLRLSELISLSVASFNQNYSVLKVIGKRKKERMIPLHTKLQKLIKHYIEGSEATTFLITTSKGKEAYPMMIYRIVHKYLLLATTTDKPSPHTLRHTFATHLLEEGAPLKAIKDLLGHSTLAATQLYTHTSLKHMKQVFEKSHPRS